MSPSREQFARLWSELGARGHSDLVFGTLEQKYSEPPRAYHTIEHVVWGLQRIDEIRDNDGGVSDHDANAVRWAMWFHDAVMDLWHPSGNDERRSADFADDVAKQAGLPESFRAVVERLILQTAHVTPPSDPLAALMVDADLSILGASPATFAGYEQRVRLEWSHVGDEAFRAGRRHVLERFEGLPSVYTTAYGRAQWEQRARENIRHSLLALGWQGRR